jgi:hypothetical protein
MDDASEPLGISPTSRHEVPPLRIHHILATTLVAAVLLSIHEVLREHDVLGLSQFFRSAQGIAYTLATAIACSFVLIGCWWRHKGVPFFHQPGHWLLVSQSVALGSFLFAAVAALFWSRDTALFPYPLWMFWFVATHLLAAGINFWAAFRVADSLGWRLLFVISGAMALVMAITPLVYLHSLYLYIYWLGGMATTILLVGAAITDRRTRRRRDWPHWTAVALQLTLSIVAIAQLGWQWWAASG